MNNDFLLIKKMQRGDDMAFDVFVRRYYKDILNYCYYHCYDKEYAEDLVQQTFVHFFEKLSEYRYKGKTKNYLYTIAGNLCKDYFKKAKAIPLEDVTFGRELEDQKHQMDDVLDKIIIEQALVKLPDELQEIVTLYYFQELKLTEVADQLQISLPLVKYRLKRAKIQLGKLLQEEESYESEKRKFER